MQVNPYSPHWSFAMGYAFEALERLIWNFKFEDELSGHARYVGIDPGELAIIIDGFLREREYVPGGNLRHLEELRNDIQQKIVPAYRAGKVAAQRRWHDSSAEEKAKFEELDLTTVTEEARKQAPPGLSESAGNWFVEAYCRTMAMEWFYYVGKGNGTEGETP